MFGQLGWGSSFARGVIDGRHAGVGGYLPRGPVREVFRQFAHRDPGEIGTHARNGLYKLVVLAKASSLDHFLKLLVERLDLLVQSLDELPERLGCNLAEPRGLDPLQMSRPFEFQSLDQARQIAELPPLSNPLKRGRPKSSGAI